MIVRVRAAALNHRDLFITRGQYAGLDRLAGRGPDLIIDGTGGATFDKPLGPGGRVVTYGATTGQVPQLTVRRIFWKELDVLGSTMGAPDDFRSMLDLVTASKLEPVVDRIFPLGRGGQDVPAHERGKQFGKIVLTIA